MEKQKNDVRIIREGGQYHVFVGTADVWLNRRQLERLYEEVRKQLAEQTTKTTTYNNDEA